MTAHGTGNKYTYDAANQRLRKTENGDSTYYVTNGLEVLAEYDENDNLQAEHIYSLGRMLAKFAPGAGHTFFYTDHLGSTRLVGGSSESADDMRRDYYPYGEELTAAGNDDTPYTFVGKELDSATGLHYFGARYYDPRIGRWYVPDALADRYLAWSPYNYSLANPLSNFDPDGNSVWTKLAKGVVRIGRAVREQGFKSLKEGATYADAFSGIVDDVTTLMSASAGGWAKAGAALSLASELAPVSIGDVKEGVKLGKRLLGKADVVDDAAKPAKLFHYTSADPEKILQEGLKPGAAGKVFTTPSGDLSPLQAQIDLALPPNRGLPTTKIEIDVTTLKKMGVTIPEAQQVGRKFNMPGGGTEVVFPQRLPKEALRKLEEK